MRRARRASIRRRVLPVLLGRTRVRGGGVRRDIVRAAVVRRAAHGVQGRGVRGGGDGVGDGVVDAGFPAATDGILVPRRRRRLASIPASIPRLASISRRNLSSFRSAHRRVHRHRRAETLRPVVSDGGGRVRPRTVGSNPRARETVSRQATRRDANVARASRGRARGGRTRRVLPVRPRALPRRARGCEFFAGRARPRARRRRGGRTIRSRRRDRVGRPPRRAGRGNRRERRGRADGTNSRVWRRRSRSRGRGGERVPLDWGRDSRRDHARGDVRVSHRVR